MARLIHSPTGGRPQGSFELSIVELLVNDLPDSYRILPNFSIKQQAQPPLEYDVVVLAPHAVFVLEAKEWYGRLTGDDTEWLLNQQPKRCPLWLADLKCKVLKARLGALASQIWIDPILIIPPGTQNMLGGNWAGHVVSLNDCVSRLQDETRVRYARPIESYHQAIQDALQGAWGTRKREIKRRYGGWEATELLFADEDGSEYRAKRALVADPSLYRLRTWQVSPYTSPEEREKVLRVIRRPTEALAKIGRHPNLLPILAFDEDADNNEFYEVTEWSEFGTLHGYLRNPDRAPLTLRERLDISVGVAAALEAVHSHGLVHRNVCPSTILIGFDLQARLTDFDRAYIEGGGTVFERTASKVRNPAYLAPELANVAGYAFNSSADMYSFGVLLYELLVDKVPFESPAAALTARGKPTCLPSEMRDGIDSIVDDLVISLLNSSTSSQRPPAVEALKILQKFLGTSNVIPTLPMPTSDPLAPPAFEIGCVVDGVFRIDQELGSGSFSRVYKVFHLDHGRHYTMKLLKNSGEVDVLLREYNEIGQNLPSHPNIAKMVWMARLAPPLQTPYILNDYIEGETLEPYCDGRKSLSWKDIQRIGIQVLSALEALHPRSHEFDAFREQMKKRSLTPEEFEEYQRLEAQVQNGILHRDIKPANILLELPSHTAKLIDFNIASKLAGAQGKAGTPRYWAPDRGQPKWRADMDLFSLGIVLYELVTHQHPFPNNNPDTCTPVDPRLIVAGERVSDELSEFLLKAIQPNGEDRFSDAKSMKHALASVSAMYAPPQAKPERIGQFPGITLDPGEAEKKDYNPYVTRLLTLYSQAQKNNGGTRGLDDIARLTYVETRLDLHLAPAIADGRFRLVVVTGNAGDGKTAFLQQVEAYFKQDIGIDVEPLVTGNGARWEHAALQFRTNYDGSQDEGNVRNDDVLAAFLNPFSGSSFSEFRAGQVRLIAINEGRLLDFLEHSPHSKDFGALRRFVLRALETGDSSDGMLIVNLNVRAVAAGDKESLVERQLAAMLKSEIWTPCEQCSVKTRCPLKHNSDTFRDAVSGPAVRARVRRLFEVIHLRRRTHMTIRDMRSALSWLLLRDRSCQDIKSLLASQNHSDAAELTSLYYTEAFAAHASKVNDRVDDRLVSLLRQADVGLVNDPQLDRRLDHNAEKAVPWMSFDSRSNYGWEVLAAQVRNAPRTQETASLGDLINARRVLVQQLRRRAYYERRDDAWQDMLPYRSWRILSDVIYATTNLEREAAASRLRDRVVEAISLSEGLRSAQVRKGFLALRVSRVKNPSIRSYRLFSASSFTIQLAEAKSLGEFLEFAADSVDLVADESIGRARLRISLDLLEMMELIRSGYRPSPTDLQGLFVNLLIFRNALLNLPFDRVMVTKDDENLYEIVGGIDARRGITLTFGRYDATAGEQALEMNR
jgi:serine/threonine protein kinase